MPAGVAYPEVKNPLEVSQVNYLLYSSMTFHSFFLQKTAIIKTCGKNPHIFKLPLLLPFPWNKRKEDREVRHRPQECCGKTTAQSHPKKPNKQMKWGTQTNGTPEDLLKFLHKLNISKPKRSFSTSGGASHSPISIRPRCWGKGCTAAWGIIQTLSSKGSNKTKSVSKCVWSSRCWWLHTK